MAWRWRVFAVAVARIVLVVVASWWRSRPRAFREPAGVAALAREIDRVVPESLPAHRVPGASVAVVHDGQVRWTGAYGDADAGTPDAALSHTAGINVDGYPGLAPGRPLPSTRASLAGASGAGEVRIVEPPGRESRYSGGGYTVAQYAAETTTGEPFAELVDREVLQPLGMTRSGFDCTATARGHDRLGAPVPDYRFAEQAAGGLCSTAPDLGRFAAVLMRVVPVAHAMGVPGRSRMEVFPDDGWALVVLTNGDNGADVISGVRRLLLR